jgi:putative sporulation protein YtaF
VIISSLSAVLILAAAISIDSFSVGVTYGLRKIKLGLISSIIISGISMLAIFVTGSIGSSLADILNTVLAEKIGSIILICMGIYLSVSAYLSPAATKANTEENQVKSFSFKLKSLNIIIKILKKPSQADFDRSGTINILEAIILGLALALDATAAGFGTGLAGFSNRLLPVIIGIVNFIMVKSGYLIGSRMGNILPEKFEIFPGFLIIILGIIRFI